MAPVAVFESLKGWLLYTGLGAGWGDTNEFAWLVRGDLLRAQASSGHSLNLGFQLAMSLGMYLFLRTRNQSRVNDVVILLTLMLGMLVSYSRGGWVTAMVVAIVVMLLRPGASRRFTGSVLTLALVTGVMYVTPSRSWY